MVYAPIVIPTLNRVEHLSRCLESLKKSPIAKETDLYIGLDYPPSDKYIEGYERMKEYLNKGIEGFKTVNVVVRSSNLGGIQNGLELQNDIFKKYEYCIYSEDDNEFAPGFLEYMNDALTKYIDDKNILAVYGYRPKIKAFNDDSKEAFLTTYFSAYGCGLWRCKEAFLKEKLNVGYMEELACDKNKQRVLKKNLPESICYLCSILLRKEPVYQTPDGRIEHTDTERIVYSIAEHKYLLCSPIPLVKNWGYDGSGEHCESSKGKMITETVLLKAEHAGILLPDTPKEMELDYKLEMHRIVPYLSAHVRLWLWRIIAKRKMH